MATQTQFEHLGFDATGLSLHQHETPVDDLIVFIHGLVGSGDTTWGNFPSLIFDQFGTADVAVFNYATGWKRIRKKRPRVDSRKLRFHVNQLASHLQRLTQYERIHLVGHSLGGAMADLVARRLVEKHFSTNNDALCNLASITYFASPRLGSGAAAASLQWLVGEFRILKRLSGPSSEIDRYFTEYLESNLKKEVRAGAVQVPRFACIGGHDKFVKAFSTTVGLPEGQWLPLQEGHMSISKPTDFGSPQVSWLIKNILDTAQVRQQTRERQSRVDREARRALEDPSTLVAEYWGVMLGEWEECFHEARRTTSTADVTFEDKREVASYLPTDLIVAVSDASDVLTKKDATRQSANDAFARVRDEHQITAGLAAVGPQWEAAEGLLKHWIEDAGVRRVSAGGALHGDDLKLVLATWMRSIVNRRTSRIEALRGRGVQDAMIFTGNEAVGEG